MWRLYIIYHQYIQPNYHEADPFFSKDKVHLFQTSGYVSVPGFPKDYSSLGYITHRESDFQKYDPSLQKKKYFAPSVLYHIYKNSWYPTNFLGFLEYDFKFQISTVDLKKLNLKGPLESPCKFIENHLKKGRVIILSARWRLSELNAQKSITVNGRHWLDYFLEEYSGYYQKSLSKEDLLEKDPIIPTQQSFLCHKEDFQKIMEFIAHLIDNSLLEKSYPAPATLLERYIGLCIHLSGLEIVYLPLSHQAHHGYRF